MARHAPVCTPNMHVDVRVTRCKDPPVPIRIEADDLDGFPLEYKPNFGLFMKLGVVRKPVAFIENMEYRTFRCRVDQEREGLTDIDAKLRRELHDIGLQCRLVTDCGGDGERVPGAYLRIDKEAGVNVEVGLDVQGSIDDS